MLTVTVPDQELLDRLTDLSDRVELVLWDLLSPLPRDVAERVSVVQIGHYWAAPERWLRLYEVPNLRYVMLPSAGFEHAIPRVPPGVTLCNGRGVHSTGTSELALALILASQRGLADALVAQNESRWCNPELSSLADRRVLVVGAGWSRRRSSIACSRSRSRSRRLPVPPVTASTASTSSYHCFARRTSSC